MDEVGVDAEEEDDDEDDDGGVISLLLIIDSYLMYIDICI